MQQVYLTFLTVLLVMTSSFCAVADTLRVKTIPVVEPFAIKKKVAKLTVNFVFEKVTPDYWMYYSRDKEELVFEFFGVSISDSLPVIKGTEVISNLHVENGSTDLAFNRKVSRLIFSLEPGWHYESWIVEGKTLRLSLWTNLDPSRKIGKKSATVWYFLGGVTIAIATTALLLILTGS